MSYISLLSLFLLFLAIIFHSTAAQLVVQSEKLEGFEGCSAPWQRQIVDAWHDAMKLADIVYKAGIHFDSTWAEPDFFGPASLNGADQSNIRAVLNNAHTFKLAHDPKIDPDVPPLNWGAWKINVRCDDWRKRCPSDDVPGPAAYTDNPGADNSLDTINFCGKFFSKLPSCTKAMDTWGKSKFLEKKEDLQNYQCQGYAALHELFHLDSESKVGSQGHIYDRRFNYKREYDGRFVYQIAYGPLYTRVLAAWDDDKVGFYTGTNADSLAQFCLAKWVAQETGYYPRFPGREKLVPNPGVEPSIFFDEGTMEVDETTIDPFIQGPLISTSSDLSFMCSDFDDSNVCIGDDGVVNMAVTITSFSSLDPTGREDDGLIDAGYQDVTYDPYVLPDDPSLECASESGIGAGDHTSVDQPWAQDQIASFCKLVNGIPMDPETQNIINMPYPRLDPTAGTLWLVAGWQLGDASCGVGRTPTEDECNVQLGIVLNGCDVGNTASKYGGVRVNECIAWMVLP